MGHMKRIIQIHPGIIISQIFQFVTVRRELSPIKRDTKGKRFSLVSMRIQPMPGEMVNGEIWIMNKGGFDLYWEITEWPEWGSWDFGSYFPKIPPGGLWIVFLNMTAPNQKNETFTGHVKVVNKNNESDYERIDVSLSTSKNKSFIFNFPLLSWLFERFPNAFPILRYLLGL